LPTDGAARDLMKRFWHYFKRRDLTTRMVAPGTAFAVTTNVDQAGAPILALTRDQGTESLATFHGTVARTHRREII